MSKQNQPRVLTGTYDDLLRELDGTKCRCGNKKRSGETFCRTCYYSLSSEARHDLYRPLGNGYAEAYERATTMLDGREAV